MMLLLALGLIGAQATAQGAADAAPAAQMKSLLQNCDAHKFETTVDMMVDGKPTRSKVKLCGTEGQSDADWLRTLRDAAVKTEGNLTMPKATRDQVVAALNGEIARLVSEKAAVLPGTLPPPRKAPVAQPAQEYASLPPMPTAPTAPVKVLGGVPGLSVPLLPTPKLTFSCLNPSDLGGDGPCTGFERDTMLTVRAGENLPAGTALRFVRDGTARADVELAQLQRGKTARFTLPSDVCSHSGGGTLEIRIVRSTKQTGPDGQEVGKDGPYNLRC